MRGPSTASGRLMLVEVVGPAGAGKSALIRALRARNQSLRPGLTLWGLPRHLLLATAVSQTPVVLRTLFAGHRIHPDEVAQMARLGALARLVDQPLAGAAPLLLLDEGPVFGLSWLEVFHSAERDSARTHWRRQMLGIWARRLDAIVRVDAADHVLAERIRTRAKHHPVKADPDEVIYGFTARFRGGFDRVIAHLTALGRVRVLDVRTDVGRPRDHAARLERQLAEAFA